MCDILYGEGVSAVSRRCDKWGEDYKRPKNSVTYFMDGPLRKRNVSLHKGSHEIPRKVLKLNFLTRRDPNFWGEIKIV